jgi:hypothetical protein
MIKDNKKMSLNYEIIGKLTELGYIEHKIFVSCKPVDAHVHKPKPKPEPTGVEKILLSTHPSQEELEKEEEETCIK